MTLSDGSFGRSLLSWPLRFLPYTHARESPQLLIVDESLVAFVVDGYHYRCGVLFLYGGKWLSIAWLERSLPLSY